MTCTSTIVEGFILKYSKTYDIIDGSLVGHKAILLAVGYYGLPYISISSYKLDPPSLFCLFSSIFLTGLILPRRDAFVLKSSSSGMTSLYFAYF